MVLINILKYTLSVIFLGLCISCHNVINQACYEELRTQVNRELPSLDVLMFDVVNDSLTNKLNRLNLDRLFFVKDNDTLESIGYVKTKQTGFKTTFFYKTTRFINLNDTIDIKDNFKEENIILLFSDGSNFKIINCSDN